jgi:5'-3' exonuclease
MGVLGLFAYFKKVYNENNYTDPFITGISVEKHPQWCDWILLDLNAVFHNAVGPVYSPEQPLFMQLIKTDAVVTPLAQKHELAYKSICEVIDRLCTAVKPRKGIYLAIDGVPGCAKQAQQRKRRYIAPSNDPNEFDRSASISVGTTWMQGLCDYIKNYAIAMSKGKWNKLQIIYSDMNIPGEGEHKLIRWIEKQQINKDRYCIYSPDADLLFLSLPLMDYEIYILRPRDYRDIKADYIFVNIQMLRKKLIEDMFIDRQSQQWKSIDISRAIRDYVLYFIVLGNDFIPHSISVHISTKTNTEKDTKMLKDGIRTLINCYTNVILEGKYLIHHNKIQHDAIKLLFQNLKDIEQDAIVETYKKEKEMLHNWKPSPTTKMKSFQMSKYIVNNMIDNPGEQPKIRDFNKLRRDYYISKFSDIIGDLSGLTEEQIHQKVESVCNTVCAEYLRGFSFVIQYYLSSIPTFDWYYPFNYAPFNTDVYNYLCNHEINQIFKFKKPLTTIESLVSVLPKEKYPTFLNLKSEDINKIIQKLDNNASFPKIEDVKIDAEGADDDHKAVSLLPMISYDEVKKIMKGIKYTSPEGEIIKIYQSKY